jgi:hypothetical protein
MKICLHPTYNLIIRRYYNKTHPQYIQNLFSVPGGGSGLRGVEMFQPISDLTACAIGPRPGPGASAESAL